jgi:5-bromo-4-chloroindolyl phosphate hydrolysis protein
MKLIPRLVMSALIGTSVLLLFSVIFEAGALLSSLFGMASFIGGTLLFSRSSFSRKLEDLEKIHGIKPDKVKRVIKEGRKKIRVIKRMAKKTEDKSIRDQILAIHSVARKIFDNFEYDPKDIKAARQFLNYYLDATIKIIEQYSILSEMKTDEKKKETLKEVEKLMGRIEKAFENQLTKLYDDDFINLDTEIRVLENAVKHDGL